MIATLVVLAAIGLAWIAHRRSWAPWVQGLTGALAVALAVVYVAVHLILRTFVHVMVGEPERSRSKTNVPDTFRRSRRSQLDARRARHVRAESI
jgi:divalent metal cation (Fe/Co/Zn/Cd) transporter